MTIETKPICVIYFPENMDSGPGNRSWIYEYMAFLNGEKISSSSFNYGEQSKWGDYHWFCFYKQDINDPELKVFHPKDFTDIQYQELKSMIQEAISNIKPNNTIP